MWRSRGPAANPLATYDVRRTYDDFYELSNMFTVYSSVAGIAGDAVVAGSRRPPTLKVQNA